MNFKFYFLFSGIYLLTAFHLIAQDNLGKVKYQVESSFDITKDSAQKILQNLDFEKKERTDFVFDAFDGENFLLFPGKRKIRFRMKEDEEKKVLQINTNINFINRKCPKGQSILIREKENGEINLSANQYEYLKTGNQLLNLPDLNPSQTLKSLKELDQYLKKIQLPLKSELEKTFPKKWVYLPINLSKKKKYKHKVNFGYGDITVSISGGEDYIGEKFLQEKWELEFQVNPKDWIDSKCKGKYCGFEKSICLFMESQNLSAKDFNPPKISPYDVLKKEIPNLSKLLPSP
ncbi:MAG TPA: hypothetical protein PK079_13955 [Leptospiraceae bacterium]|nr:hypothetical protein [Leptospiraceae bacterium]HMW08201.1 hypothetical protein [Leptospiraceae bacterium]HMX33350.1 hypothetical protein [Leptospiraceae bacterium]HMZ64613.1 hypothetical protein [Leptospiraceae bacterium]HNA09092.1 hypothetical protein [Leptospiraceae bacterium]